MKISKVFLLVFVFSVLLTPAIPTHAQTSATVENFFGEGSFMDGYDFSANAVQRVGESGPDNPGLYPDFYLGDSNFPVTTTDYHSPKPVINYGTTPMNSITEIPSESDSRFASQAFVAGNTYGMFTLEGDYVVLQVLNFYTQPFGDYHKTGMNFNWMYVEGGLTGELTLSVYPYDKTEFALGDSPTIGGDVLVGGQPLVGEYVTVEVTGDNGEYMYGASHPTDEYGQFSLWLEYGSHIPTGYRGNLIVNAQVNYNGATASQTIYVPYGNEALDLPLDLQLSGPDHDIEIGGWEDIGIGGTITSQGVNVDGALVTMVVAGQTFQTTTGTHTSGQFNWYWANNSFPAGKYTVQVTVTKDGYQTATGTIPFTLIGEGYNYWVTMDPIPASLPPGNQVPFPGALTLGGQPHYDWIEVHVTFPNGRTNTYLYETQSNGLFTHVQPAMNEIGTYQLVVKRHDNQVQISDIYTWSVGATPTPTVTPSAPQPTQAQLECKIVDVAYPSSVLVNNIVNVTGRVICTDGEEEVVPQEGWDVYVSGRAKYESPVNAPVVQTNADGTFATSFTPNVFTINELFITAHDAETNRRDYWFGPLSVAVELEPAITLSQTDYDQGEVLDGKLNLNPNYPAQGWDSGLEIYYQITGPVDGAAKQYLFESQYYYDEGVDRFQWMVPSQADAGKYVLMAYISGTYIGTQTIEAEFYVNDIRHTTLSAGLSLDPEGWSSALLGGNFSDFNGVPIPYASVRVVFVEDEKPHREFNLTGTTDEFGNYEIDLEPLDMFAAQGLENPWEIRDWATTVYADKDGYATGSAITGVTTPTVDPNLEIVSVTPSLDTLSEAAGNFSFEQMKDISIQVRVRYNNIFGDGSKLEIYTGGHWAVTCIGSNESKMKAHVAINGEEKPEWVQTNLEEMRRWPVPGYAFGGHPYFYPTFSVEMPANQGNQQESTFTVSGKLYGYRYTENSPNQCGGGNVDTTLPPNVPHKWMNGEPAIKIKVNLGDASAGISYSLSAPSLSAKGEAWVSPTSGELNADVFIQSEKYVFANQTTQLSILAVDLGATEITSTTSKTTSEIKIEPSGLTNEKGKLILPLTTQTNPCKLEEKAQYYVNIKSSVIEGEKNIPIQLRCVDDLAFEVSKIHFVQATELTDTPPQLVANKEAGVRVYFYVEGEIYQSTGSPAPFDVKFELFPKGSATPFSPQVKTVSITERGASVAWSSNSKPINQAGIGEIARFKDKTAGGSGRELLYVDFVFTPYLLRGSETDYKVRITFDPTEYYGKKVTEETEFSVKKMKRLQLLFVPVDVQNIDMNLVWEQVSFLDETFPLAGGDIGWGIASNYPSSEMPFKWTTSYMDQICAALQKKYGSAGGGSAQYRIVGLVDSATWNKGLIDYHLSGSDSASGVHFTSSPQVVLVRHGSNQPNTLAHELGHSYGLYLDKEQYEGKDGGNPIHGLMVRNGKIYRIPADWDDQSDIKWIEAFGQDTARIQKHIDSGKTYKNPYQIYDLMGNPLGGGQQGWVEHDTYKHLFDKLKDPPEREVLIVQGMANENDEIFLEPTWTLTGLPDPVSEVGTYTLQLLSSAGDVRYETRFGEKYSSPVGGVTFYLQVPWFSGLDRLRILEGELVKVEQLRSPNDPQFSGIPTVLVDDELINVSISWAASDPDGDALSYSLRYQCGDAPFWFPLTSDIVENSYYFDTTGLPGGESCVVRVLASDGFNTIEAKTEPFGIIPKNPAVHILVEDTPYDSESPILIKGMASDPEDGNIPGENLNWISDRDGELGTGSSILVNLSQGTHLITLWAEDTGGNLSYTEATIQVQPENILSGMGSGLQSMWVVGFIALAVLLLLGAIFFIWLTLRKRRQPEPVMVRQTTGSHPGQVQDAQGQWWSQDPNTGSWSVWNGHAWQPTNQQPNKGLPSQRMGAGRAVPPSISRAPRAPRRKTSGSCLFAFVITFVIGAIIVGGISLIAFNFFPEYQIPYGQGDEMEILKWFGGGSLLSLLGFLMINGGMKAIITRRAVVEDEWGRQREKRGCGAILNGLGSLFFGVLLFSGGLGMMTLTFYQEILPYFGF